ncbi:MAG: hypothetical protein HHJ12_13630 [Glaciimonas sp.]|nr:hypothetical protein [Glaciimonas sp.]
MNNPIRIYPERNGITLPDGSVMRFTQRWEATLLAMLLMQARANRDLQTDMLRIELERRGQTQPLNRTQYSRLIKSLTEGLDRIPGRPVLLEYGPRKATVGPWRLRFKTPCAFEVDKSDMIGSIEASASASFVGEGDQSKHIPWPYPLMLSVRAPDALHKLLSACLISDAFAAQGNFHSALETLQPIYSQPLSCDLRVMLNLREALYSKRLGEFTEARAFALKVLKADPAQLQDPTLRQHASFLLDRIDYDESPGTAHIRLWDLANAPSPTLGADLRTAPDWHNLRALLARRRLLGIATRQIPPGSDPNVQKLHHHALLHLETAIYWALSLKDWEKLQAFVANVAFHLQSVLPLGLSNVRQIFAWYALMMNYAEKLDAGKDSAWEYLFLGEFWLDHEQELRQTSQPACSASDPFYIIQEMHPAYENFYLRAIERIQHCADYRQVAIAQINYLRFIQAHLGPKKKAAAEKALCALLQNVPSLRDQLEAEGYGAYLPRQA